MRRQDLSIREVSKRNYQVFKGYSINFKENRTKGLEEHYVVPWEMTHEDWKKPVYH